MKQLPIVFLLFFSLNSLAQTDSTSKKVLKHVEIMPEFPGGQDALIKYLIKNIAYPRQAQENYVQGKALIAFTVCEDGKLCDLEVLKDPGGGCAEEAKRVIAAMPKWQPGIQDGKPVKVKYTLPISFQLNEPKRKRRAR